VNLHATDLFVIALFVVAASAVCYALLVRKLRQVAAARDLKIADQLGALDAAIQALETRLAERRELIPAEKAASGASTPEEAHSQGESISGEIKAVIAAAATAVFGKHAAVKSVRSVPTPWSQQGRVLVQGSHNLRVRQ
jgi:F0F1-type ATP synthase membrane subunit b/b'